MLAFGTEAKGLLERRLLSMHQLQKAYYAAFLPTGLNPEEEIGWHRLERTFAGSKSMLRLLSRRNPKWY